MNALPVSAGIGLKPDHCRAVLESSAPGLWLEAHPENYMVDGGPRLAWLEALRRDRALSFHGVGASLGGLDPFDAEHLLRLRALVARFEPEQLSEHAAFSAHAGRYHADLLPLPRTMAALVHLAGRIDAFQQAIGRRILIENPSNYLPFRSELDEPAFLVEAAKRSGCGLLMDVNNIWISARNVGLDAEAYVRAVPGELVGEIHVAGHSPDPRLGAAFLIDSHGEAVAEDVWRLLAFALATWGPKAVLVERDADIPPFADLLAERDRAQALLGRAPPLQSGGTGQNAA